MVTWKETDFFTFDAGATIRIDIPAEYKGEVRKILPTLGLPAVLSIDPPCGSPGSNKKERRAMVQIHFRAEIQDALTVEVVVRWLKKTLQPFQAVVGHLGTLSSPQARLVDVNSAHAGYTTGSLCSSSLVVSSKLLLVETNQTAEAWSELMTETWTRDPIRTAEKIRRRPSDERPGVIAQIRATASQITAAKNKALHAQGPDTTRPDSLRVTLELPIGVTGPLTSWMPHFMKLIGDTCQLGLKEATDEDALDWGQWRAIPNFEGGWSGKVIIQLQSKQEMEKLQGGIHGKGARILGHVASIGLSSDHADMGIYH